MKAYLLEYRNADGELVCVPFSADSAKDALRRATEVAVGTKATLKDDYGALCQIARTSNLEPWYLKPVE